MVIFQVKEIAANIVPKNQVKFKDILVNFIQNFNFSDLLNSSCVYFCVRNTVEKGKIGAFNLKF